MPTPTPKPRPRVFIASPLFNPAQHAIIESIERLLTAAHYEFYSARRDSGSDKLSPIQRKDINAWNPVFESNEQGLDVCRVCIAVLEYALPTEQHRLGLLVPPIGELYTHKDPNIYRQGLDETPYRFTPLELPDAGTVWETGYLRAQGKLVIGYHSKKKASHLNLMLSHGCDGLISGVENLRRFLNPPASHHQNRYPPHTRARLSKLPRRMRDEAQLFDWTACEPWTETVE